MRGRPIASWPQRRSTRSLGRWAGRVTDPGRYMFKFGWLTITANDLAVWQAYPNAAFTLIRTLTPPPATNDEEPVGEEFRLGTFELRTGANYSGGEQ